jgi:hypothetical protein
MNTKNYILIVLGLVSTIFIASCKKTTVVPEEKTIVIRDTVTKNVYHNEVYDPTKGIVRLQFSHTFQGAPFEINTPYTDGSGNTYQFNEIRYWVSNVTLFSSPTDSFTVKDGYWLIEHRDSIQFYGTSSGLQGNMKIEEKIRESIFIGDIPPATYTKIKFSVGVDPYYNDNFALKAGELDINQMAQVGSWAWKTSYIFLRTKGTFLAASGNPLSDALKFVVETGGNNQYRSASFELPSHLTIRANETSEINFSASVDKLFGGGLPSVSNFTGSAPTGWSADPNLSGYQKFVNGGTASDMTTVANNVRNNFFSLTNVTP